MIHYDEHMGTCCRRFAALLLAHEENAEFQALILKHRGMKKTLQKAGKIKPKTVALVFPSSDYIYIYIHITNIYIYIHIYVYIICIYIYCIYIYVYENTTYIYIYIYKYT